MRQGLSQATFEQRRSLVELLIDRVIVTDGEVEIRYVIRDPADRLGAWLRDARILEAGPQTRSD